MRAVSEHIDVTNVPLPEPPATRTRAVIRRENLRELQRFSNAVRPAGLLESERRWYELHRLPKDAA